MLNTPDLGAVLKELQDRGMTCGVTGDGKLLVHPRSRLDKELFQRIKKHKKGIIAMVRIVEDNGPPICTACLQKIPESEPYITLERYETGERRPFHSRPAGMEHMGAKLAEKEGRGEVFLMHLMHTCDDVQADFACSGGCFDEAA